MTIWSKLKRRKLIKELRSLSGKTAVINPNLTNQQLQLYIWKKKAVNRRVNAAFCRVTMHTLFYGYPPEEYTDEQLKELAK